MQIGPHHSVTFVICSLNENLTTNKLINHCLHAPPVASAASAASPAAPLVAEENEILLGQYYFIITVNSNSIPWVRDPLCLVLQWVDNKVVSMIRTVCNTIKDHVQLCQKVRNAGILTERLV